MTIFSPTHLRLKRCGGGGTASELITQARAGLCQIATGSYVGTGTYGQSNPTVINCGFKPKMVLFYMDKQVMSTVQLATNTTDELLYGVYHVGWIENMADSYSSSTGGRWTVGIVYTQTEQGLSYYVRKVGNDSGLAPSYQNNVNGYTYLWLAIG